MLTFVYLPQCCVGWFRQNKMEVKQGEMANRKKQQQREDQQSERGKMESDKLSPTLSENPKVKLWFISGLHSSLGLHYLWASLIHHMTLQSRQNITPFKTNLLQMTKTKRTIYTIKRPILTSHLPPDPYKRHHRCCCCFPLQNKPREGEKTAG